jgi:hypothetical protein
VYFTDGFVVRLQNAQGNPAAARNRGFQNPPDPPLGFTALFGNLLRSTSLTALLSQTTVIHHQGEGFPDAHSTLEPSGKSRLKPAEVVQD